MHDSIDRLTEDWVDGNSYTYTVDYSIALNRFPHACFLPCSGV